eukprot:CAMPEP_0172319224 /NCGR_PEP_ID=MMETSP1058-20130122/37098_1 /TAXON_ID=83371 /ORGANISM="Detonula confervacea, Strain CCMP 353" /LENGTH=536 /DNA_ID=CAMNT_0013034223 /DNA_START=68 /DNA_END=1678 /DNA_ORIENTATION=+
MSRRPDAVTSISSFVKSEPTDNRHVDPPSAPISTHMHDLYEDDDDDDPVVRTIDVFISPALTNSLHLLQFPIQPVNRLNVSKREQSNTPTEAKFRPKHNMLELDYPIPPSAQAGNRQLTDKMCLSQRTFTSNAVAPVTHMALAKFNRDGTRLNVVPMQKHVFQMRPSFEHLHDEEDDDPTSTVAAAEEKLEGTKSAGRQRPIMYQKKETERSANARRNSYAYHRANQESEEWIELDVHGSEGKWSSLKKEKMGEIKCKNRENELKLAKNAKSVEGDGGYVKSMNYLDSYTGRSSGEAFVENLSDWTPSAVSVINENSADGDDLAMGEEGDDVEMADEVTSSTAPSIGATEQATAELASKLAILLQTGNGTMIPYRVLRSRFLVNNVSDEMLTMALSSCAVLVRGNFSLKSNLAKFLSASGGGEGRKKLMRELRDLILLLLNMHGMVQRERLTWAYSAKAERSTSYDAINADTITFVLQTVAKKSDDCWVAKVEDDEEFAADFPKIAACHGIYWIKKKEMLVDLIELYENAQPDDDE